MSDRRYVKTPDFIITKIKDLPISYTTGVVGGLKPNDAHILFIADRVELVAAEMPGTQKIKAINQEVQAEVHMSPTTFKSIALWMMKNVEKYEEVFGEIKAEPKNKSTKSESEEYVK